MEADEERCSADAEFRRAEHAVDQLDIGDDLRRKVAPFKSGDRVLEFGDPAFEVAYAEVQCQVDGGCAAGRPLGPGRPLRAALASGPRWSGRSRFASQLVVHDPDASKAASESEDGADDPERCPMHDLDHAHHARYPAQNPGGLLPIAPTAPITSVARTGHSAVAGGLPRPSGVQVGGDRPPGFLETRPIDAASPRVGRSALPGRGRQASPTMAGCDGMSSTLATVNVEPWRAHSGGHK